MLGIEFTRTKGALVCHQNRYALDIIDTQGMTRANTLDHPMEPGVAAILSSTSMNAPIIDETMYRSVVGELLYLTVCTRPDITFAVNLCARYVQKPREVHNAAIKKIIRYLKGTPDVGLVYKQSGKPLRLVVFSDSDFANDRQDSKSTSGHVILLNGSTISWRTSKQKAVSSSTVEAEYIAACAAVKEVTWLHWLLCEITAINNIEAPLLLMDSEGAEAVIKRETISNKTKHIRYSYHMICDYYKMGLINVTHVKGTENPADAFTKSLAKGAFKICQRRIRVGHLSDFKDD